jgi:YD repeat-containing protein
LAGADVPSAEESAAPAFGCDAAGRLTSESLTVTFGQTTTYTVQSAYDAANRRTGITYPDGSVVARQYTARDQLSQIDYNTDVVATFGYDAGSRRTSRVLGDTPGTQTAWVYGRQDNLPTAINAGVAGASFSYTCDANKNKLTEGIHAEYRRRCPMILIRRNTWTRDDLYSVIIILGYVNLVPYISRVYRGLAWAAQYSPEGGLFSWIVIHSFPAVPVIIAGRNKGVRYELDDRCDEACILHNFLSCLLFVFDVSSGSASAGIQVVSGHVFRVRQPIPRPP